MELVRVQYIGPDPDGMIVAVRARLGAKRTRKYHFHPYLDIPEGIARRITHDPRYTGMFTVGGITSPHFCPKCKLEFKGALGLQAHNDAFHKPGAERPYTKLIACKVCGEEFDKAYKMMNHKKRFHKTLTVKTISKGLENEKQVHAPGDSGGVVSGVVACDGPVDPQAG